MNSDDSPVLVGVPVIRSEGLLRIPGAISDAAGV